MSTKTKSPLTANPLRLPGQSVDEELERVLEDKVRSRLMFAVISFVFALMEWWRWYFEVSPNPLAYSLVFVITAIVVTPGIWSAKQSVRRLKLGRDGERAVGQTLLRKLIGESVGKTYAVQPTIAFPGWFIQADAAAQKDVWVLEPKALLKWIRARKEVLNSGQVREVRLAISGYIRKPS